jgi:DNA-binding transcriptional LysR family regulator
MNITDLDLNLLVVFDTVLKHRNITVAGVHLGLSQPAMSYALAKLRTALGDPLFVRVRSGMEPTRRALTIAEPVAAVLKRIRTDILSASGFDPRTSQRRFALCTSDVGEAFFVPSIARELRLRAPRIVLGSQSLTPATLEQRLESGEIDVAVGYFPDLRCADFYQQALFTSHFVCIARPDNPYFRRNLTLNRFLDAPQVDVATLGRSHEVVDQYLLKRNLKRNVQLHISHFLSLREIIPQTDLLAIVPREAADFFSKQSGSVDVRPLPFKSPTFRLMQHWHKRYHSDLGNRWFREVIRTIFQKGPTSKRDPT